MKINAFIIHSELEKYDLEALVDEEYLGTFVYDVYGIDLSLLGKDIIKLEGDKENSLPLLVKKGTPENGAVNFIFNSSYDTEAVLSSLKNGFKKYDTWESELNSILMRDGSVDEYLKSAYSIFENSLSVSDSNSRYLALAGAENLPRKYKYVENLEFIEPKMFETPEDFVEVEDGVYWAHSIYLECNVMYVNLFSSDKANGHLVLCDYNRPFKEGDRYLLKFLARYVEKALENYDIAGERQSEARCAVRELINGEKFGSAKINEIKRYLQFFGKTGSRNFYCIVAESRVDYFGVKYVAYQTESELPGTLTVPFDNTFVAIMSRSCDFSQLKKELAPLLEKYSLSVGVSDEFEDFFKLKDYYEQALSALGFGLEKPSENNNAFFFRDYALKYFFRNGIGNLPAELIAAKGVVKMKERDLGRGVKYCESLKIYLEENMNATNAAKRLSIQRNTFLARLERIQKLLGVNLDDPTERLYVLISLMILDI